MASSFFDTQAAILWLISRWTTNLTQNLVSSLSKHTRLCLRSCVRGIFLAFSVIRIGSCLSRCWRHRTFFLFFQRSGNHCRPATLCRQFHESFRLGSRVSRTLKQSVASGHAPEQQRKLKKKVSDTAQLPTSSINGNTVKPCTHFLITKILFNSYLICLNNLSE